MHRKSYTLARTFWSARLVVALVIALLGSRGGAEPYVWDSVRIGGGGFVSAIVPSRTVPGLVYARTDVGGAYRWDAAKELWLPLQDWVSADELGFLGVESLAIDETSPNKLYLLVGTSYFNNGRTAILRSDDYGASFQIVDVSNQFKAHGNGMGRQNGEKLQVDPLDGDILYCGTRYNGIFKSVNAGLTWTRLAGLNVTTTGNENGVSFVLLDSSAAAGGATQRIFAGVSRRGENLFRSDDGGQSFVAVTGGPSQLLPQRAVLASDGNLYVTYADGAGPHGHWNAALNEPMNAGAVWKYNVASGAWSNVSPAGVTRPFGGISVDPANAQRLVVSTINTWMQQYGSAFGDRFYLTTNGGASWTDVVANGHSMDPDGVTWIPGQSIHWCGSMEFDPFDTKTVWVTSGNGVYRTDDIDATDTVWTFAVRGLEETVPLGLISIPDGPLVSVIGDYDGFVHTDPKVYPPVHRPGAGTTTGIAYAGQKPEFLVRVGSAMYYSTDTGGSWTRTATVNNSPGNSYAQGAVGVNADGTVILHCPSGSSVTYRSTNNGGSWTTVTGLTNSNARPIGDPVNANRFYAYAGTNLRVSNDAGVSFAAAGALPSGGNARLTVAPGREGHLWVALYGSGLRRSTDGGQSFTSFPAVTFCEAVGLGKAAEGAGYFAVYIWGTIDGVRGLYRSVDEGATWLRVNDDDNEFGGPANGQFVVGDMNVFGRVYMSTAGRGIAYGEIAAVDSVSLGAWLEDHFTAEERADAAVSGLEADPDEDGLANLLEWMLGTDPRVSDRLEAVLGLSMDGSSVGVARQAELETARLAIEVSLDLETWWPVEDFYELAQTLVAEDGLSARHRYEIKDEQARVYLRFKGMRP